MCAVRAALEPARLVFVPTGDYSGFRVLSRIMRPFLGLALWYRRSPGDAFSVIGMGYRFVLVCCCYCAVSATTGNSRTRRLLLTGVAAGDHRGLFDRVAGVD